MKIVVLLKRTPDTEAKIKLVDGKLDLQDVQFIMNPYDEFALEEALQIKEKQGDVEVVVCSLGGDACRDVVVRGLAMGADRGVLVNVDDLSLGALDSLMISKLLAAVVRRESADLVLCGQQGIDADNMHVGVMVAELLGWGHVNVVNKLQLQDSKQITAEREIEGGRIEVYTSPLPLVIGANKALNSPRYVSLPGIMKAKRKPLDCLGSSDLNVEVGKAKSEVVAYEYPPAKPTGKVFKDKPVEDMVAEVVRLLRDEAKVI
ncbi:MAG: electron transfer flavoprotein subunit beta/FixA family protein [Pseudomonadota bacterium]|nr:electron transfer flavoprotein subunit beta/FixA family protein [Pseudomonadota bacterium]